MLRVSRRTVERIIVRGDIVPIRVGSQRRFSVQQIVAYLEKATGPAVTSDEALPHEM